MSDPIIQGLENRREELAKRWLDHEYSNLLCTLQYQLEGVDEVYCAIINEDIEEAIGQIKIWTSDDLNRLPFPQWAVHEIDLIKFRIDEFPDVTSSNKARNAAIQWLDDLERLGQDIARLSLVAELNEQIQKMEQTE